MTAVATPVADPLAPDPALIEAQAAVDAAEALKAAAEPKVETPVVPDTYTLKLPDGSTQDVAIVERTAAIARELGLSNEAAQQLLEKDVALLAERETAANADLLARAESWKPETGERWIAQNEAWKAAALADKDIGGTPEKLAESVQFAERGLVALLPEGKAKEALTFLKETGLASHPVVIGLLASAGRRTTEGAFIRGDTSSQPPKSVAERMYPGDGTGPKVEAKP